MLADEYYSTWCLHCTNVDGHDELSCLHADCICVCMYVCMCVCMYVCICVYVCMYVCVCVCMYVCTVYFTNVGDIALVWISEGEMIWRNSLFLFNAHQISLI